MLIASRQRLSTLTESSTLAINDFQVNQVTTNLIPISPLQVISGLHAFARKVSSNRNIARKSLALKLL